MMAGLAAEHGEEKTVMIDATYLKAHRTATSLGVKKGARTPDWPNQRRHEHQVARHLRQSGTPAQPVRHGRRGQRLHRCASLVGQPAECRMASRGPWLRRRLVQRSIERQRHTRLHPRTKAAQDDRQIRQAPVQAPQPHRDHVRQAQGLAARRNQIRQMPEGLPVSHRSRRTRYLLAMSPEPKPHKLR